MDVFRQNAGGAFSMMTLTALVNELPHQPTRLGELGIFEQRGMRTLNASIEKSKNVLSLVPVTPRGGPGPQGQRNERSLIQVPTVRLYKEDTIMADEIQDVRAFGSENDLLSLQDEINARNTTISNDIEVTVEYHRIGALKGIVYDASGGVLLNLFDTFGVVAQTEIAFDLSAASPAAGVLRNKCNTVLRLIEDELGAATYSNVHAMCSSQFFDAFTAHAEFRAYQIGWPQASALAQRTARRSVEFGGITWEEYRGKVGGTSYVDDDKAHIFPLGVSGLFLTRYGPPEYFRLINTIGLPRYSSLLLDPTGRDAFVQPTVQTQILNLCTRPRVLIPARRGA